MSICLPRCFRSPEMLIKGRRIGAGIVSRDFQAAMQAVEHGQTLAGASKELGVPR